MVNLTGMLIRHDPTDECDPNHCYFHMVDEPGPGYHRCFECGHLYASARELRQAYRQMVAELDPTPYGWVRKWFKTAEGVWFCPHCAHDF